MCGEATETWEHIWKECMVREVGSTWQEKVREILGKEGEGEDWLRELEKLKENGGVNEVMNGYGS